MLAMQTRQSWRKSFPSLSCSLLMCVPSCSITSYKHVGAVAGVQEGVILHPDCLLVAAEVLKVWGNLTDVVG